MASYIEDNFIKSKLDWANSFSRNGKFPLDRSSLFGSYADAELYAKGQADSRGLGGTSYIGQIITVYENDEVNVYKINADRTLGLVGAGAGSLSVENVTVIDGKVQEATADNIGQIIYITVGSGSYQAGPYVVSGEGTISKLGTISGSGDIASIANDVNVLKGEVGTIKSTVESHTTSMAELRGADATMNNAIQTLDSNVVKNVVVDGEVITSKEANTVTIDLSAYAKKAELPSMPSYTIGKLEQAEEGFASSYKLYKDGVAVGATINIAKDKVLQSAVIKVVETDDQPVQGYKVGDKYFEFSFQNQTEKLYLLASELVDAYTGGSHVNVSSDNVISINTTTLASEMAVELANTFEAKGEAARLDANVLNSANAYTNTALEGYVAKEDGKGLSSNDFTAAEKEKLAGIASGAEVNTISAITVNGKGVEVEGKVANISYIESLDGLSADEHRAVTARAVAAKFNTVNAELEKKFSLVDVKTSEGEALPETGSRYAIYLKEILNDSNEVIGYEENLWMGGKYHVLGESLYATKALASSSNSGLMSSEHYMKLENLSPMSEAEIQEILSK